MLNITGIKPMFNNILTTMNRYEKDEFENGIIMYKKGDLKEYQTVLEVGPIVKGINKGDKVMINPIRYAKKKHQEGSLKDGIITDNPVVKYEFNVINVNGEKTSSPFVIKAIGSSIYMNSALTRAGGTVENLNRYIQISVKPSNNITIKKYTGVINPKYVKYAEQ